MILAVRTSGNDVEGDKTLSEMDIINDRVEVLQANSSCGHQAHEVVPLSDASCASSLEEFTELERRDWGRDMATGFREDIEEWRTRERAIRIARYRATAIASQHGLGPACFSCSHGCTRKSERQR